MSTEANHNKIITQAAKSVLKKEGLFQKGTSRTWIDDNGWFWIVVEFQPSNWNKGSYLNVAIHYLWSEQDYISYDFGHRVKGFVAFSGDEERFYADMVSLARSAMAKVVEYRGFRDVEFAKEQIMQRNGFCSISKELYEKMMICGLTKDKRAKEYYLRLLKETEHSELDYDIRYRNELLEKIMPVIDKPSEFEEYIKSKIMKQRMFWHSKASMKKLRVERL